MMKWHVSFIFDPLLLNVCLKSGGMLASIGETVHRTNGRVCLYAYNNTNTWTDSPVQYAHNVSPRQYNVLVILKKREKI